VDNDLVIIWGISTIYEFYQNDGAFEVILGTIIWLLICGGAFFALMALFF